ncbi:hypothetical protein [Paracoccus sp. 22332]|uniref:hypothetical protein n=1 Tax=Paracoccus sp. 22332 TaxID=3453913 RepID=UPI003F82C4CD
MLEQPYKMTDTLSAIWYKTGNADSRRFPSLRGYQRPQQDFFVSFDVDRVVCDLDVLGEGPDVFPPIAALSKPEPGACFACQFPHGCSAHTLLDWVKKAEVDAGKRCHFGGL